MAKYLVETYYTCSFKVSHYLDDINEKNIQNIEKRDDGKFEILDVKLDNRKTKNLEKIEKNKINVVEKELPQTQQKNSLKINQEMLTQNIKDKKGKIIDGDQNNSILVRDLWTFEKKIQSKDLNWILVETSNA